MTNLPVIYRLEACRDEDYPKIDWSGHRPQADEWLKVNDFVRNGGGLTDSMT